jgi:hypothetical protein
MAYLKSIIAGIMASTAILAVLYVMGLLVSVGIKHKYQASQPPGGTFFVEWHFNFWPTLILALVVFAFGFYWEFQRASIRPSLR